MFARVVAYFALMVLSCNKQNTEKLQAFLTIFLEPSQLNQKLRERTQETQTDTSQDNTEPQPVQPSVSIALHIRCRNCHRPHNVMHNIYKIFAFLLQNAHYCHSNHICTFFSLSPKFSSHVLTRMKHLTRLVS